MFFYSNAVFILMCFLRVFVNVCFSHENSSGYYRTSVYFLSKIFADLVPNRIIPIFVFSAIAYYMMGKSHTHKHIHTKDTNRWGNCPDVENCCCLIHVLEMSNVPDLPTSGLMQRSLKSKKCLCHFLQLKAENDVVKKGSVYNSFCTGFHPEGVQVLRDKI